MKLVFFGTPDFAVKSLLLLHRSRHEILAIVTSPDRKLGRGLKLQPSAVKKKALELDYLLYQPDHLNDVDFIASMRKIDADIYIVVAFRRLPEILFNIPGNGAVNLHASLLPRYRGSAPIHHAILNGEIETGVTTFKIEKSIDTGKILLQNKYKIKSNSTLGEVYNDLADLGSKLIISTLNELEGGFLTPIIQDVRKISKAPKVLSSDAKIDWNKTAEAIHNHIRAFSPTPGAYAFFNKKRIKLFSSLVSLHKHKSLLNGEVQYNDDCLQIGTSNGIVEIYEIQIEGKKRMLVKKVINGLPDLDGAIFE